MNPLAVELNEQIKSLSPSVFACLSEQGKRLFFPKGILSQSAEAKQQAHKFNATIGIATEGNGPMHLAVTKKYFSNLTPAEIYPYAPPAGRPKLRELWKEKMVRDNPSLEGKKISDPVVTNALTHGLSIVADLFADKDDIVISPDKLWGNYRLTFVVNKEAKLATFPLFVNNEGFNVEGLAQVLEEQAKVKDKLILILNFPNNPTGYTPTVEEADQICAAIKKQAEKGTKIVTVSDDAYFGLFFEESIKESLFGKLADLHENVLAIKLDGATKEDYAWGFRTGFITFGNACEDQEKLYAALEPKVKGSIRGVISNCPHVSQSVIEKILVDPDFAGNHAEKYEIMKERAVHLKTILAQDKYDDAWDYYPFNSGYFMCLKLKGVDAEELRLHLLKEYGVGGISLGTTDFRVAFSCIEKEDLQELFDIIYKGVQDLKK